MLKWELGQPFADVVFHSVELADGQTAADLGALADGVGVLLDQITGEELGEIGDAAGLAAGARGDHVGAGLAEVRECFVAPEEVAGRPISQFEISCADLRVPAG
jgi:hypothetical protein